VPDGTVLDGELLAWRGDAPLPLAQLQRRLDRCEVGLRLRQEVPVVFMAYDVLEHGGEDWRGRPLSERRIQLETLIARATAWLAEAARRLHETELVQADFFRSDDARSQAPVALGLSPVLAVRAWDAAAEFREQARRRGAEGLVLKRRDSVYGAGRQRGAWWKWKVAPFTCAAVLVGAQAGRGRRAALLTDCTFAVWQGNELVPVARAHWGLTEEEMDGVDAFVRANTLGRFGPVRSVKPEWVFELAFEGIAPSLRHKAGFTLRVVRIVRQRHDKVPAEADTVERLQQLVRVAGVP